MRITLCLFVSCFAVVLFPAFGEYSELPSSVEKLLVAPLRKAAVRTIRRLPGNSQFHLYARLVKVRARIEQFEKSAEAIQRASVLQRRLQTLISENPDFTVPDPLSAEFREAMKASRIFDRSHLAARVNFIKEWSDTHAELSRTLGHRDGFNPRRFAYREKRVPFFLETLSSKVEELRQSIADTPPSEFEKVRAANHELEALLRSERARLLEKLNQLSPRPPAVINALVATDMDSLQKAVGERAKCTEAQRGRELDLQIGGLYEDIVLRLASVSPPKSPILDWPFLGLILVDTTIVGSVYALASSGEISPAVALTVVGLGLLANLFDFRSIFAEDRSDTALALGERGSKLPWIKAVADNFGKRCEVLLAQAP